MEVIGRKKGGLAIGYFIGLAVSIAGFVITLILCIGNSDIRSEPFSFFVPMLIFILIIVVIVMIVIYLKAPKEPIKYNRIDAIFVNEQRINLVDIIDVSYKQNRNRYTTFDHGTITVQTRTQIYKANYVDECERVCKLITKLAYDSQHNVEQ